MNIAVIGWGDLVWSRGNLELEGNWNEGGPLLPLEFCRIGGGFRVTLALCDQPAGVGTYWAISSHSDLVEAGKNLRQRLKTMPDVLHFLTRDGDSDSKADPAIVTQMTEWLEAHPDIDAAVWCGWRTNWELKRGVPFSIDDLVAYLRELEQTGRAEQAREYFVRAPVQNRTSLWKAVTSQLSWQVEESGI